MCIIATVCSKLSRRKGKMHPSNTGSTEAWVSFMEALATGAVGPLDQRNITIRWTEDETLYLPDSIEFVLAIREASAESPQAAWLVRNRGYRQELRVDLDQIDMLVGLARRLQITDRNEDGTIPMVVKVYENGWEHGQGPVDLMVGRPFIEEMAPLSLYILSLIYPTNAA